MTSISIRPALWGAVGLAVLSGCASLQQPAPPPQPDPTPVAWTATAITGSANATDLAGWWARFGDPALEPLIGQALRAGTDVEAAQARLRQARAQRSLAEAGLGPRADGSGSAQGGWTDDGNRSEQYRVGLDASWEADLWGAGAAGVQAARAGEQASALSLAQTRVAVAAEVALNLLQLRGTQARYAIARRNLDSQQQTLQITRWRQEAGLVTQLDVEQARTAVEQTRAALPTLRASATQAMNALAVLTGRAPGALHADLATHDDATLPAAPADLVLAIPAEVLRQRPDVQAA
ncbi:MAG TPA: TolC family protein, partial [Rubrivivax sp.]|nr:TolC family protein [Rubrivivax sp.]